MHNHELHIVRGRSCSYALPVKLRETGEDYILKEGESLIFAVKHNAEDNEAVLTKPLTHRVDGGYYLELAPEDTAHLEPLWYKYDVALQSGTTVLYTVIYPSDLRVIAGCAELGDGA